MRSSYLIRGFTLIELAVALAIAAVLLSQAVPMFSTWMQNVQVRTATESIQNGLQLARAEALRRNRSVMFWLTSGGNPPQADWMVGCMNPFNSNGAGPVPEAAGDCPGSATGGAPFNWIQYHLAANEGTPLAQVNSVDANGAPTSVVTFNSLGMVLPSNLDNTTAIATINVSIPNNARPLRVTVSSGQIRMCDPALLLANDPRGC
ncbi:MAG: GspH/FimT family pseudopilin [Burkholderiaceae bacterium]|nr:GspH/FimT family pseudopilin [Burkholderiaceae bacterium]